MENDFKKALTYISKWIKADKRLVYMQKRGKIQHQLIFFFFFVSTFIFYSLMCRQSKKQKTKKKKKRKRCKIAEQPQFGINYLMCNICISQHVGEEHT